MFTTLPPTFFNLLISKNRDLYVSALFVLRKAVRQDLYLTRDDLVRRISISLEEKILEADLDEDDKFESEDLTNAMSRAYFIVRKLRDYGWINIDFNAKNSFEEYIAIPAYSSLAINFLYSLSEESTEEYNSMVYSVYAALKLADGENSDYYEALITAYKNTEKLNEVLANLYYGVRSIEQRIADDIDINNVVLVHFNEYINKLHDRYYHPYKTFDSIFRFRSPINKILKKWQNDTKIRKRILESAKNKTKDVKADALYEYIAHLYDYTINTYENIEDKMELIDNKIYEYTASTIDKIKHLVNVDESYKGKITYIIKCFNEYRDHQDDLIDMFYDAADISQQEYATIEGLYNKREMTIQPDVPQIEIFEENKVGDDVDEMFDKIKLGYNTNKIKEYVLNKLENRTEISAKEMNIANDEEFILTILAMLRSDEKELPFEVIFETGYSKLEHYVIPNIKFIKKEGKR